MVGNTSASTRVPSGGGIGKAVATVVAVMLIASSPARSSGCGLSGEVFCENFEGGISSVPSRSGDFNPARITGGRQNGGGDLNFVGPADIPACRAGSVRNPLPPHDALICEPVASRKSHHALVAAASQNYGDAVFRIDQPFDFGGRTGTIRTDMSLHGASGNGSPQVVLSDQPQAVASISGENGKGTALSNGFIIHFRINCEPDSIGPLVRMYRDYAESILNNASAGAHQCSALRTVRTSPGRMNRVELRIAQDKLEIWATDFSNDGVTFGPLRPVFRSGPIKLSFARGWYSFGAHNHATIKYDGRASHNVYFDNIAFDGPLVNAPTVYQVPDNTAPAKDGQNLGWPFYNRTQPAMQPLIFTNVDIRGIARAKLIFNLGIDAYNPFSKRKTFYRLNGGAWHRYHVPQGVMDNLAQFAHRTMFALEVDVAELVQGNNTVQFASDDLWMGVAPYVSNVDLMVWTQ